MCDLGLVLGIGTGLLRAGAEQETADKNAVMIGDQLDAQKAAETRRYIVETEAAAREGHDAIREADRAVGFAVASAAGMGGGSVAGRIGDQQIQGQLSLSKARDRRDAAGFNYTEGSRVAAIEARNRIATNTPSGGALFADVLASGISGYGAFG